MGQYFSAVLQEKNKKASYFYSHDYGNGMKLMEHSYIGNHYVGTVYETIREFGPMRCGWVGDYSNTESLDREGKFFLPAVFSDEKKRKRVLRWYKLAWKSSECGAGVEYSEDAIAHTKADYLLNYDRKEYIRVPALGEKTTSTDDLGCSIHPLPILTCSNPGSGGNFRPHNEWEEKVFCSWCGDMIGIENEPPKGKKWTEIPYLFECHG